MYRLNVDTVDSGKYFRLGCEHGDVALWFHQTWASIVKPRNLPAQLTAPVACTADTHNLATHAAALWEA